jgi:hypothetical protein
MMDPGWWDEVEYGDFKLSEFRWHAAALARYLIRARERDELHFLGSNEVYRRWELEEIVRDPEPQLDLLEKASVCSRMIDADMVAMGGSGGILPDDPLAEFKSMIAGFASEQSIGRAIDQLHRGNQIEWSSVAAWDDLEAMRDGLDQLPRRENEAERRTTEFKQPPIATSARVTLFPFGHQPVAVIDKEPIQKLTKPQHDVVRALLEAVPTGLTEKDLISKSRHGGARGILRGLAKKSDHWKFVIDFPGVTGGRYRIF